MDLHLASLVKAYNLPVPRYTSYPTVPFWHEGLEINVWKQHFRDQFTAVNSQTGISLYIHLPFCKSLCTYCGCNKKISETDRVVAPYISALLAEWTLYKQLMSEPPVIREIHLGGGTPTFFSPENLDKLLIHIKAGAKLHPQFEGSFEGHPNNTTLAHLEILNAHSFTRVSFGVQDNDAAVQRLINRIQPWENVLAATNNARKVGYRSVNYDLIYGLPGQTLATMQATIRQVLQARPDRIAFYSYAHVPWASRGQRLFDEHDLPDASLKMDLYLLGKQLFSDAGYTDIGMDHFALPGDDLYKARINGKLHRNFMGYTVQQTGLLLGLSVSSISDADTCYAQNHKSLAEYYEAINNRELPIFRGFALSDIDIQFKSYIKNITCKGVVHMYTEDENLLQILSGDYLQQLQRDGLIAQQKNTIKVTPTGTHFLRNIAKAFDLHLVQTEAGLTQKRKFSQAI